ncbi:hypothetical protein H5410_000539 [Solanum commersonii]|uniref:Uncharacterized protein n=1 Tax=Solanum commersonii TaxID=4109 RepID=A0A9J6AWB4_SOLCO|nr:hypothetical protein H5410_000539 [Solanum commersonii]
MDHAASLRKAMLDAGIRTVPAHSFINTEIEALLKESSSHSLTNQQGGHIFVKMHSKPGSKVCLSSKRVVELKKSKGLIIGAQMR